MRASILLVVIVGLFASSQALDLSSLKDVGAGIVNNLLSQVKDSVVSMGQKLLGSLMDKFGKRDVSSLVDHAKNVAGKFKDLLAAGHQMAKGAFGKAIDALRAIAGKFHEKLGLLKGSKQAADAVDDVVAQHHVEQKRILGDLFQKGKDLLGSVVQGAKHALSSLKAQASEVVSGLLQKGTDLFVGKRATLSEHLQNIGGAISSAVSPFKDIVKGLGNTLKGHFSNLVDTVKGHVNTLKGKLSGHVDDLKTHGQNLLNHGKTALGALGEVVTDILKQTLSNAGPSIDGLAKTAADAGSTVLNHFTGADKPATF